MTLVSRISDLAGAIRDKLNTMTPRLTPAGGTSGQVLRKSGTADYAYAWASPSFEIALSILGKPTASQLLAQYRATIAGTLIAASSSGGAQAAANAAYTITINKRTTPTGTDTAIGTISWAAGGTVPTISLGATAIAVGDILRFVAPATPDSTLDSPYVSLAGVR